MKSFLLSSLVLLLCAGCASHTVAKGPDGQDLHIINCSDFGIKYCYDKANEVCTKGFVVYDQSNLPYGNQYVVSTSRELIVECK